MRLGIFGAPDDVQAQAFAREAAKLGADTVLIDYAALENQIPVAFEGLGTSYAGEPLDDLRGALLRFIPSPFVPAMERDGALVLYPDWYASFMQARERSTFYLSWLLKLQHRGAPLVNPPHAASVLQFKPLQLEVLERAGARVPRTLISNDPTRIRAFARQHREVIFKPVVGGALTRVLDRDALDQLELVASSPVIFQERVGGDDLRVMLVGDEVVSCVAIDSPEQHLDFRGDPAYRAGDIEYREVPLPPKVRELCRQAARACGLEFAGIDLKHQGDDFVFLELNSAPIYFDVEVRLGHRITEAVARHLVERARAFDPAPPS